MLDPDAERARIAERRLADARSDARSLAAQNERLNQTLREAREQLLSLKQQVEAMMAPPLTFGRVVCVVDDLVDVHVQGRRVRTIRAPELAQTLIEPGDTVFVNDLMTVVAVEQPGTGGELAVVVEADHDTAVVRGGGDAEYRLRLAPVVAQAGPQAGDSLLVDRAAGVAFALVSRRHVEELVLTERPDVSYADIGGLGPQIERITDAVELPFRHRAAFERYQLRPPKGVLLYGPPGCGKTMIAKAVAHSLAAEGEQSYFLNIKGPELLNKYVGESERQIRLIFQRARELAADGHPVIVFFDEMDALFRTRGTGVSSDVENTIVPQLLSEIDGVEGLTNVIIIGASNREDMIDPAILRAGRLDVKIKLDRPDRAGAAEIIAKYLTADLPLHPDAMVGQDRSATVRALIDAVTDQIYARTAANRFVEVTYASGTKEVLYLSDFASGAMLRNIVDRAKKLAIKAELNGEPGGLSAALLGRAVHEEMSENEDLPDTMNPDDWARVSGRKGERIVFLRTFTEAGRAFPVPASG